VRDVIQANRSTRNYAETLRACLKDGRVVPHYQPIVDCRSGETIGYETLARMRDASGELISAGMFIETMEKYGLDRELDRVIISQSLAALEPIVAGGDSSLKLFINLSAQEIQGRGVLGYAEQLCLQLKIPPQTVVFEIMERDAIGDMAHMRKFLTDLRENGFLFALDDFGSGYNSFHYLRELSFDYVKIDGAFVKNIMKSTIDRALVKNLSCLCQDIGTRTIAEFVESEELLLALREMNIDYAQGFHLGRPAASMG
jgi:EAL domain-containing protein (putative c-di-GMP-specific phosphodiesterase class I)